MMHDLKWSPAEKLVARKAFEQALQRELTEVIAEAKNMAAKVQEASDLWNLEQWLTERRKEIDRKYEYRYSVLPIVFATLLNEGRLTENDLNGLGPDKFEFIRRIVSLGAE